MVDKALTAIQTTGLFPTAILEWDGFINIHQTWPEFKLHFQEAYELQLQSGGFNGNNQYHGAANAFTDGYDSIEEINESITNIYRAHNANTEATSTEMAALWAEVAATRQAMVATQQQMAMMAQSNPQMQAQTFPAWPPAYPGAYQQPSVPPQIPPTPVPQAAYAAIPPLAPPAYQLATVYQPSQAYVPPIGGGGDRTYGGRGRRGGRKQRWQQPGKQWWQRNNKWQ